MAATIAKAIGVDRNREKETHRLGSKYSTVQAATWHTFASAWVNKDGSGFIRVRRNGTVIHEFTFGPESEDV